MRNVILLNPWCPAVRNPRTLRMERVRKSLENDFTVSILCCPSTAIATLDAGVPIQSSLFKRFLFRLGKVFRYFVNRVAFPDAYLFISLRLLLKLWKEPLKENVCVISFSPPFSTHLAACVFRSFYPGSMWIADIGDLYYKNPTSVLFRLFHPLQMKLQKYLLSRADQLVFNSRGIQEVLVQQSKLDRKECSLIYNGSSIDFSIVETIKEPAIRFLYAGSTYPRLREGLWELEILSEAMIILQGKGFETKITLAGRQCEKLTDQYSCEKKVEMIYQAGEDKLVSLYRQTDFLICFSNGNYPGLPSKLSEYRASGLPIVCFVSGNNESAVSYLADYEPCFIYNSRESKIDELINFVLKYQSRGIQANMNENQIIQFQWTELLSKTAKC